MPIITKSIRKKSNLDYGVCIKQTILILDFTIRSTNHSNIEINFVFRHDQREWMKHL